VPQTGTRTSIIESPRTIRPDGRVEVCAVDRLADVHVWLLVSAIAALVFALFFIWGPVWIAAASGAILAFVNLWFLWRARNASHWTVCASRDSYYIRTSPRTTLLLFTPMRNRHVEFIVALDRRDVSLVRISELVIVWPSHKRTCVQWILFEIAPESRSALAQMWLEAQSRDEWGKGSWLAHFENGVIRCRWRWDPDLSTFLKEVEKVNTAGICLQVEQRCLDVSKFGSSDINEQDEMIRRLHGLGFAGVCMLLLRRYRRMSLVSATAYLARISNCGR
jgi:hypothetical protein